MLVAHPAAELYGSDRVMLESVTGFVEAGWRVVVSLREGGPLVAELADRGASVVLCPTPVVRKSILTPRGLARFVADTALGGYRGLLLLGRIRPQVVYVSTVTVPLWHVLARLRRIPVLCHVHEAEGSASPLVRQLLALPLLLASRVVANSEFSVETLRRSIRSVGAGATVVDNAVPGPSQIVPPRARIDGPLRAVYVGRLSARKGVRVLVDAAIELAAAGTPVHLDIVGAVFPGYEWFERELRDRVSAAGLGESVAFHGFKPDVWSFLASSDVAVVPSTVDEPFGNTAVEAVLSGRPVVVSATSGLREASAGYRSAWQVPPGDSAGLAAGLVEVLERWSFFRDAALVDAARAAERHSPERYRRRMAEILDATVRSAR